MSRSVTRTPFILYYNHSVWPEISLNAVADVAASWSLEVGYGAEFEF